MPTTNDTGPILVCARELAARPLVIAPKLRRPFPLADGTCHLMSVGDPPKSIRDDLVRHHLRCDRHDRPIVTVLPGAATHLPPVDQERAPC